MARIPKWEVVVEKHALDYLPPDVYLELKYDLAQVMKDTQRLSYQRGRRAERLLQTGR